MNPYPPYPHPHAHPSDPGPSRLYPPPPPLQPYGAMNRITSMEGLGGYESSDVEHELEVEGDSKSGGKRKKKDKNKNGEDRLAKKTRQSQSCDACRARKVKCDRPPPGSTNSSAQHKDICSHCEHLGLTCTFDYKPKKRGPPNMYMRKMQSEPGTTESPPATEPPPTTLAPGMPELSYPALAEPKSERSEVRGWEPTLASASASMNPISSQDQNRYGQPPPHLPPPHGHGHGHPHLLHPSYIDVSRSATSSPDHPRQYPLPPQHTVLPPITGIPQNQHARNFSGGTNSSTGAGSYYASPQNNSSNYPTPISNSPIYARSGAGQIGHAIPPRPLYMYVEHPPNPNNPIEKLLPRQTLYEIIDLYFDYIYCLIPCLHRPSFTHDLNTKREERPGEEEWTSLVLSIVGSTLTQLPRSFVKMSRREVKSIIVACNEVVRQYLLKNFDAITINRTIHRFITRIMGGIQLGKGIFGALHAYLLGLKAHEEKTYASMDPLQRVFLRRSFWLVYGADVSIAGIEATPVFFHEDDCADVTFPEELDDEYISEQGYLPQPEGHTSILSGFSYVSQLHRITGQLLDKHRRDKRKPPSGLLLQMRLNEVNDLYERTMTLMNNCPRPLRLDYRTGTRSVQSLSPGWDAKAKNDIMAIFSDPNYDTEVVKDHFLVQQANIYVTQQQVRFMILQYRDELHELQLAQERNSSNTNNATNESSNQPWIRRNSADKNGHGEEIMVDSIAERDEVICDLLAILQKIPLTVLAVNSFPIVQKVQFVASTLLDVLDPSAADAQPESSHNGTVPTVLETRAQKAQRNLWQFLNILSEIEGLYSLEDD
uniref:Zn(2)-C6 fungal-type domain-containing protein n=1 Tax=Kwoniella bestiolae CBS 10118 TaxID=1296100 RepID=A0A1B9GAK5_9TREE|nr:hypothetical protein I302_02908 [Kwoniella bestiolae CBS 10118]OCF28057.1 hypothetical protein I302_02908 [Kwoniella bestiolae CBS 10118]